MSEQLKSPLSLFYQWESTRPNDVFLNQPFNGQWNTFTYKQAGDQIRRMAAYLKSLNLEPKSKVGIVSKNCAHWIMSDLAIMMAGYVSVPVYPNVSSKTIEFVLDHSETQVLFVGKLDDWDSMRGGVPSSIRCISFPWYEESGYEKWDDIIAANEPISENPDRDLEDLMTIIYTSGTTGNPKGVMHTFFNLSYAIDHAKRIVQFGNSNSKHGRLFSYLPLSHIAERMLIEMGCLATGAAVFFAESLDTFKDNMEYAKPTIFLGVPRIWTKFQMGILAKMPPARLNMLLKIPILSNVIKNKIKSGLGFDHTNHFLTGAAPMPQATMEWFKKLGIVIQDVYGMTEDCAFSHCNRHNDYKFGTVGKAMPTVELKLTDEEEICIKSPCIMKGYYKLPEKTAETVKDGYLHTGDQGEVKNGYLKITGRVKDLFKTGKGKYVVPNPIELKLSKNQNVEQVCVVGSGIPQPLALVVLSADARGKNADAIKASLAETLKEINPILEKHEKLQTMVIVQEEWTPENAILTPTLKIKRNAVDKKYQNKYDEWYATKDPVVFE